MKSKFLIGAVAVVALGVLGVALLQQPSVSYTAPASVEQNTAPAQPQTQAAQPSGSAASASTDPGLGDASKPPAQKSGYTLADVASHNSRSSCWTAINGKVYNVTSWISQHPGGEAAILSLCGTDGSSAFNNQHGGQGRPESELATFYIGPLTN